ncbi:hypothetical protein [Roseateles puraquae]|uniref:Uncharacterized protein n=2 Tax=Roseateles puraquae TaxID=431059 RepID=A0A254MZR2_9BURK|nr:hypothetical protein [Roseateles puraquae]MDG0854435.1 hypothetical protein [Roseateles puraquae]OWR00833.1 hypothetical protein CDO81_24190 [Roseateles puraquae]
MSLKKAYRRWIASMLALALVCMQLWTAAYACPVPATSGPMSTANMAGMTDCEQMSGMDVEQPQLCKAHCDRNKQTVNNAPASDLSQLPVAMLDRLLTRLALWQPSKAAEAAEALPAVMTAHTGPPDGAPPVYLALQVLRN